MTTEPVVSKNIYQRILAVMAEVSYVQKEDKKVNNQYTFVSHDAVIAKLRPALIKHGIAVIPSIISSRQEGNTTIVEYKVILVNADNPEEQIMTETIGYGVDPQDKGPGKAMSYAYKYAMLKLFCLETGDDPERDSINRDSTPAKGPDLGVEMMLKVLGKAVNEHLADEEMRVAVMEKYTAMARNMAFAQWKFAVESAIEKIQKTAK